VLRRPIESTLRTLVGVMPKFDSQRADDLMAEGYPVDLPVSFMCVLAPAQKRSAK
jgi:hypothetical protein